MLPGIVHVEHELTAAGKVALLALERESIGRVLETLVSLQTVLG